MFNNKKGLSTIVITIMLIAFVIIASLLVWTVVRGLINSNSKSITLNMKCSEVSLNVVNVGCSGGYCDLTLKRSGNGAGSLGGIDVNFVGTNGNSLTNPLNFGNLNEGQTRTNSTISVGSIGSPIASVQVTPYFLDSTGKKFHCPSITKTL